MKEREVDVLYCIASKKRNGCNYSCVVLDVVRDLGVCSCLMIIEISARGVLQQRAVTALVQCSLTCTRCKNTLTAERYSVLLVLAVRQARRRFFMRFLSDAVNAWPYSVTDCGSADVKAQLRAG